MQNSTVKGYFQYLCKSNRNLLILIMIAGFICMPFLVFITDNSGSDSLDMFAMLWGGAYFLGFALACLLPIYTFKYLYNKKSCDLYYSLPITKKDIFLVNMVFSLAAILLPIILYVIVTTIGIVVVIGINGSVILKSVYVVLLLIVFICILNALNSFLCVRCNNLIDALFICGCYLIIPFIILGCINIFIDAQFNQFMLGTGGYTNGLNIFGYLITFLSMPYVAVSTVINIYANHNNDLFSWWFIMYWVVIGIACFYFALKYYMNKDNEESENRTTTKLGYPLIIMALTTCMVLSALTSNGTTTIILLTIIFMMYMTVTFISRRSIKIDIKTIVIYIGIICICFGFSELFKSTKGFHLVNEVPSISSVKSVVIDVNFYSDIPNELLEKENETRDEGGKSYSFRLISKDENGDKELLKLHEDSIEYLEEMKKNRSTNYNNTNSNNVEGDIDFVYKMENGKSIYRSYQINKKLYKAVYENCFKELAQGGNKESYKVEFY